MLAIPDTLPIDMAPLSSHLSMPYTLTPGPATGTFLAEIARHRIVGARFRPSGTVVVPAVDVCPDTGESDYEFVAAPTTGTLTAFTETTAGLIGLIRIDGTSADFAHRIVAGQYEDLHVGLRVDVVWAEDAVSSINAIAGFRPAPGAPLGAVVKLEDPATPIEVISYRMDLHYQHAFGPYYGRLFDEIKTNRRIMGVRMPDGEGALLPPREFEDTTYRRTGAWVKLGTTGKVRAMSVINLEFVGQKHPPPYIYAEIVLDGALTRLIHNIRIADMSRAKDLVMPGSRVRAVWRETRTGSLDDISHFELIDDPSAGGQG